MKSTEMPPAICKSCLHEVDAATDPTGDATPSEGDLTVCAYCGAVSKFDGNFNLDLLTDIELQMIERDEPDSFEELMKIKGVIDRMRK